MGKMIDFKGVHYPKSVVLHAVFFYLRYPFSYRDLEEIMQERGVVTFQVEGREAVRTLRRSVTARLRPRTVFLDTGDDIAQLSPSSSSRSAFARRAIP